MSKRGAAAVECMKRKVGEAAAEQAKSGQLGERVNLRAGNVLLLCATCAYFVSDGHVVETGMALGNCRRNAPEQVGFPQVYALDFCGQHRLATS